MTHEEARDILRKETDKSICITQHTWLNRHEHGADSERYVFDVFILDEQVILASAPTLAEAVEKSIAAIKAIKPPPDEAQFYADAERDCEVAAFIHSTLYPKADLWPAVCGGDISE